MFTEPTVLILGAGASWHYGYPTGEALVHQVITTAKRAEAFFRRSAGQGPRPQVNMNPAEFIYRRSGRYPDIAQDRMNRLIHDWTNSANDCGELARRLANVAPPVIDAFLNHNDDLREVGAFIIAWSILECESINLKTSINTNRTYTSEMLTAGSTNAGTPKMTSVREFHQIDN